MARDLTAVVNTVGYHLTDIVRAWAARKNRMQEQPVIRVTFTRLDGNERLGHVDLGLAGLRALRDLVRNDTAPAPVAPAGRPALHVVGGDR
ncbi:hypothetical protein D0Z67_29195 (plasmid) [Streptomyces seoulensis]|uniref:Uncharacterized protein n=1 Tax=Streptomyces seoulensis TaxID=73044 RepID=A0A4P6U523_STRSO|nr:hypothetical protein [Streptomyces seoulensis]QBJ94447.1 hypothetical protein D0Z67_29195 [Streptomyces seoulensis]